MATRLSAHDVRRIAVEARRDPRTVLAVLAGTARDMATISVLEAARRLGIDLPSDRVGSHMGDASGSGRGEHVGD